MNTTFFRLLNSYIYHCSSFFLHVIDYLRIDPITVRSGSYSNSYFFPSKLTGKPERRGGTQDPMILPIECRFGYLPVPLSAQRQLGISTTPHYCNPQYSNLYTSGVEQKNTMRVREDKDRYLHHRYVVETSGFFLNR
jgi:hypothetical protein